jgi:hypothetical protein
MATTYLLSPGNRYGNLNLFDNGAGKGGAIDVQGSFSADMVLVTRDDSPYTAGDEAIILANANTGAGALMYIQLPDIAEAPNRIYKIKRTNATGISVKIFAKSGGPDVINDLAIDASLDLTTTGTVEIAADETNSNWVVVSETPQDHSHTNKAIIDVIDQDLAIADSVVFNDVVATTTLTATTDLLTDSISERTASAGTVFNDNIGIGFAPITTNLFEVRNIIGELTDQSSLTESGTNGNVDVAWQSFTSGVTGDLTKVSLKISTTGSTSRTLNIYAGEGNGGTLLHGPQAITVNGTLNLKEFTLSSPVAILISQLYTIEVTAPGTPNQISVSIDTANPYASGRADTSATSDYVFSTLATTTPLFEATTSNRINIGGSGLTVETSVTVDTLSEFTSGAGITIDGTLIKDGQIIGGSASTFTGTNTGSSLLTGTSNTLTSSTYSIICGGRSNTVDTGSYHIIGGGWENTINGSTNGGSAILGGILNTVTGDGNVICGGGDIDGDTIGGNTIIGTGNFIGGGGDNEITADFSVICGGGDADATGGNVISNGGSYHFMGCGNSNTISSSGDVNVILTGTGNTISAAGNGTIVNGTSNTISASGSLNFIGSGNGHVISGTSSSSTIISGETHIIDDAMLAVVAGGFCNYIQNSASFSGILAGDTIAIGAGAGSDASRSSVVGGANHHIGRGAASSAMNAFIGGGDSNSICRSLSGASTSDRSSIVGGQSNEIAYADATISSYSLIGGGHTNRIGVTASGNTSYSSILGGQLNDIEDGTHNTIGGGNDNTVTGGGLYGFIGGGIENIINTAGSGNSIGGGSNILGGQNNTIGNGTDSSGSNYIGGGSSNTIDNGTGVIFTAVISGGANNVISGTTGSSNISGGNANVINFASFASIVGGNANKIDTTNTILEATYSFIGGGFGNQILSSGTNNIICGGGSSFLIDGNTIINASSASFIGGGENNDIDGNHNSIVGGDTNIITSGNHHFIGGGDTNSITGGFLSVICGGISNLSSGNNYVAFIGGGDRNKIGETNGDNDYCTIVGGRLNSIDMDSGEDYAFIGGGDSNKIYGDSSGSAIVGGSGNIIGVIGILPTVESDNTQYCFIGGGQGNTIHSVDGNPNDAVNHNSIVGGNANSITLGLYNIIGGGSSNLISSSGDANAIMSGLDNTISGTGSDYNIICGGNGNLISSTGVQNVICGGRDNEITAGNNHFIGGGGVSADGNVISSTSNRCFIGTGYANLISGSTNAGYILGGRENTVSADYGIAIGQYATVSHAAAVVINCEDNTTTYASSAAETFNVAAPGGANFKADLAVESGNSFIGSTLYDKRWVQINAGADINVMMTSAANQALPDVIIIPGDGKIVGIKVMINAATWSSGTMEFELVTDTNAGTPALVHDFNSGTISAATWTSNATDLTTTFGGATSQTQSVWEKTVDIAVSTGDTFCVRLDTTSLSPTTLEIVYEVVYRLDVAQ